MATTVLQSTRPTSVTDVPYVTRPRPTPTLVNLRMDAPSSVTETNPAEYFKPESAETEVDLNLHNGEAKTGRSANSDFGKADVNLDFSTTLSATAESAKSSSKKAEMNMDLTSTLLTTAKSATSHSEQAEMNTSLFATQPTTAKSAKSDYAKA